MRVNIVVAIGAVGEKEDLERFVALITEDFERRCKRLADKLFEGKIEILPPQVVDEEV
jgi:hypothetical protein